MKIRIGYLRKLISEALEQTFPVGRPGCPECGGKGHVTGLTSNWPCETCSKPAEKPKKGAARHAFTSADVPSGRVIFVDSVFTGENQDEIVDISNWDPEKPIDMQEDSGSFIHDRYLQTGLPLTRDRMQSWIEKYGKKYGIRVLSQQEYDDLCAESEAGRL